MISSTHIAISIAISFASLQWKRDPIGSDGNISQWSIRRLWRRPWGWPICGTSRRAVGRLSRWPIGWSPGWLVRLCGLLSVHVRVSNTKIPIGRESRTSRDGSSLCGIVALQPASTLPIGVAVTLASLKRESLGGPSIVAHNVQIWARLSNG